MDEIIKALERYFDFEIVNYQNQNGRYLQIKFNLQIPTEFQQQEIKEIVILIIPLLEKLEKQNNIYSWNNFFGDINGYTTTPNSQKLTFNFNGVLFYTTEKIPRGDFPGSLYNSSRMLREFFENTYYAVTANYRNVVSKLKELLLQIVKEEKKDFNTVLGFLSLGKDLKELSRFYTYQSFHTLTAHRVLREFADNVEKDNLSDDDKKNAFEYFRNDYYLKRQEYDKASIISVNSKRFESSLKILVIEDNPQVVIEDFQKIIKFLPNRTEIYVTKEDEYKKFLTDRTLWESLYKCDLNCEIDVIKIFQTPNNEIQKIQFFDDKNKFQFQYIIIDLLLGKYNEGNKLIREFAKLRHHLNEKFEILVYSLSDDVEDITRAFLEGANGYVWKFGRIYSLPYLIGSLEEQRKKLEEGWGATPLSRSYNFKKLYRLPVRVWLRLVTDPVLKYVGERDAVETKFAEDIAEKWVRELPKAELHYHLGGSMDDTLIFHLALNRVRHLLLEENKKNELDAKFKDIVEKLYTLSKKYCENKKNFFNEKHQQVLESIKNKNIQSINSINTLFEGLPLNDTTGLIKEWVNSELPKDPKNRESYLEKSKPAELYFKILTFLINKKFSINLDMDDIISIFIVILGIIEGRDKYEVENFWKIYLGDLLNLKDENYPEEIKIYLNCVITRILQYLTPKKTDESQSSSHQQTKLIKESLEQLIKELEGTLQKIKKNIKKNININRDQAQDEGLIKSLYVVDPKEVTSLKDLFRGDCFYGALHFQYYESIVSGVAYLVRQAAEENIRYLEIRFSPTGYTKKGLTLQEAIQAAFDGADLMSLYLYYKNKKFIWTNFIVSAKRHKAPAERTQEIAAAIVYRNREIEQKLKDIKFTHPGMLYKWKPSKIVGVDLSGMERGFRPSLVVEDFIPIFKVCSFITIHAGEEDTADSIWEAVYKLHTNRIGHGLTLTEYPSLMELIKNLQVCIELCPSSNLATAISNEKKYPLYAYANKELTITINTDDRGILDTTLSKEYVKAARLYQVANENKKGLPMTKWELLRLIALGFRNAFVNREEKRELLRCVEEEVYQKILWHYQIEPVYPIDKEIAYEEV